ncbi:hypothetical protein FBU59_000931 [Linderina macrospora]|uniref:Uncharacterized protein n=1 Tax=Linderina macrospora TaxID=4868 RepID=A0ACC1JF96_9FUNG|nr:hypothetical protein FBU59_000931 [Linderina macrospora]
MVANSKKRTVDMAAGGYSEARQQQQHPCFWGVLHGEGLNFAFLSATLHDFLGPEKSSSLLNQSLFDYIHPEEVNRARSDLVDTFISKSFTGSNIR